MKIDGLFLCTDCDFDTSVGKGNEYYMVSNRIWTKYGAETYMLCIGCLEQRMQRRLKPTDFPQLPINAIFPRSRRLALRLKRPYFGPKR